MLPTSHPGVLALADVAEHEVRPHGAEQPDRRGDQEDQCQLTGPSTPPSSSRGTSRDGAIELSPARYRAGWPEASVKIAWSWQTGTRRRCPARSASRSATALGGAVLPGDGQEDEATLKIGTQVVHPDAAEHVAEPPKLTTSTRTPRGTP